MHVLNNETAKRAKRNAKLLDEMVEEALPPLVFRLLQKRGILGWILGKFFVKVRYEAKGRYVLYSVLFLGEKRGEVKIWNA